MIRNKLKFLLRNKTSFLLRHKYFSLLILILFAVFWIWWLPGPRAANDFSFIAQDWLKLQFDLPRVWTERGADGLGAYGFFLLGSWPISVIFGLFAYLGMTFEIWERILVLLFIFIGSFSIWKFLSLYSFSTRTKFIGALFYLVNSYSLLLIDGGQIYIAIAYALFPLAFSFTQQAIYSSFTKKVLAGLMIAVVGFFDVRFIYLLLLLLVSKALFDILVYRTGNFFTVFRQWFITGIIVGFIILGLNATWLIIQVGFPLDKSVFASFTKISTSFVNIGHSLLLITPHWYENIFGKVSPLRGEFILIPVLVFLAPVLKRKDKDVLFWLIIALGAIFLAKGGSEPFPVFYSWLHSSLPGFSFFRDSTKFFFLITLSYTMLISKTSEELMKILSNKRMPVVPSLSPVIFYLLFITLYMLFLVRPIFLNQMTGTFSIQPNEQGFQSLAQTLQSDKSFGRVLWIPATLPLSYYDLNHPVVEAMGIFNKKPFVYGVKGGYELFNFLREAPYMGEIFDVAGISYIAYPNLEPKRDGYKPDNLKYYQIFLNQLANLAWIERTVLESEVPLLKTKIHQDKVFITNNSWIVFGSDEVLNEATTSAKLRLSNNAIMFAESAPEMGLLSAKFPEAKIVLNKKTPLDLTASFFPSSYIIFPAQKLNNTPNESGWWKNDGNDLILWRDFLQSKYNIDSRESDLGGGWAVGEGRKKLTINNLQLTKGKILLARVMESSQSGKINFYQENELIGMINTEAEETTVKWHEVGVLSSTADLIVRTEGDFNVINALTIIDSGKLANYKKEAENLQKRVTNFLPENTEGNSALVKYTKINPTEYKITVSNLKHPEMIVFSSTYHQLWKLNNEASVPAYGFLNGFRVEKNGEYLLEFEPQNDVIKGLTVFIFTVLFLSAIVYTNKRELN